MHSDQIHIVNPHQVHTSSNVGVESLGYYIIHFDLQWCKNIHKKIFGLENTFVDIELNIIDEKFISNDLLRIFDKLYIDVTHENQKELEDFIINIFKKYCKIEDKNKSQKENIALEKIEKFILDNTKEQITIEDISLEVGYSTAYLNRIFKKKYGLTPHAFLVNEKIKQAKNKLLHSKDINLAQLATEVGFYDQSHFTKTFKRVFAINPNEYKKIK